MNWQFQHREFIWLFTIIPLILFLFVLVWRWKKKVIKRIGDEKIVKALMMNYSSRFFIVKQALIFLSFIPGILAVMDIRKPGISNNFNPRGIDIAIALDVSKSMLAADLQPSRLERARQFIYKLVDEMPDDRIALVLFAGRAYLQMPLTTDHAAAKMYVASAGPDAVPMQGTVISDALEKSAAVFDVTDKRFKTVVLLSDGEDHDPSATATAARLAQRGVMVVTIGIGSPEGITIADPVSGEIKKDAGGNPVISKLNETGLVELAQKTKGIYLRLQNNDEAVRAVLNQLSQIDKKTYRDLSTMDFRTGYAWFAAAMFILLLAENFVPERKKVP